MAALAKQAVSHGGLNATYAAAAGGGDTALPGPGTFLHVKNGSGGTINVTVTDQNSVSPPGASAFDGDLVVALAPGVSKFINLSDAQRFGRAADGRAVITYDGVTSLTIAVLQV